MNENTPLSLVSNNPEKIRYRHIYLCPNAYSDERIIIGLIGQSDSGIESKFVSSPTAIETLITLIGSEGVEQYQFAIAEIRRSLKKWNDIAKIEDLPSTLFIFGETYNAITSARTSLYKDILEVSSSLYRSCAASNISKTLAGQTTLTKTLHERISQLNPLIADDLFSKKKIKTTEGDVIDVPIFGRKIFGAPVSFVAREMGEPRMRAEAYVAKFNWLKNYVPQKPRVYVLAPTQNTQSGVNRLEASMRELLAIADAASVPLRHGETTDALATQVINDEIRSDEAA